MSYKQLSQDNEKAQLLQSRQWGVEEVCRLYKIPPHMVQMLAKATNNNIEHQGPAVRDVYAAGLAETP